MLTDMRKRSHNRGVRFNPGRGTATIARSGGKGYARKKNAKKKKDRTLTDDHRQRLAAWAERTDQ